MPYHVAKSESCPASKPWACLNSQTGQAMGCHPTEGAAQKQMAAVYAHEPGASVREAIARRPRRHTEGTGG